MTTTSMSTTTTTTAGGTTSLDRTDGRDVFFFDSRDSQVPLGGLILTRVVTNQLFYAMVAIVLTFSDHYSIHDDSGYRLERNTEQLCPGSYYILTNGPLEVSDERVLHRTECIDRGERLRQFTADVRKRDEKCTLTGVSDFVDSGGKQHDLRAAYIFPPEYEQYWNDNDFARFVTVPAGTGGPPDSIQNGLLLREELAAAFEIYDFSINPDDGFKVVCFLEDWAGIAGVSINPATMADERRPSVELLRWHFRQAVLANMRGSGEPMCVHEHLAGSDLLSNMARRPKTAERMEFELTARMRGRKHVDRDEEAESEAEAKEKTEAEARIKARAEAEAEAEAEAATEAKVGTEVELGIEVELVIR